MTSDQLYMTRCIQLAKLGGGNVAPNPFVGAVLVYNTRIIAEGYHEKYGGTHAEVTCINNVGSHEQDLIPQSTLYVSLEPCSHHGKTPPCTELIISHRIKKVVIGCTDPFHKVNGSGVAILTSAGIEVINLNCPKAKELNKRFLTFHQQQRPYIILKWAQSSDRFIGSLSKRILISNAYTNVLVHKWRSEEGAIMAGTRTVLVDDPLLTTRLWPGKDPLRIIIDKDLLLSEEALLRKDSGPLIILNNQKQCEIGNKTFYKIEPAEDYLKVTLKLLCKRNITSLLVEGGRTLLQSFIDKNLWDEARVITNQTLSLHEGVSSPELTGANKVGLFQCGSDEIVIYSRGRSI
ncbi:MAG: bifunctional diaminohydroxyphosphoribosylaminopyrimidine deaminase/5-amino-6-(5-phosphoribosylamino)uracil reductase RibD [Ferruginibacter sp.]